MTPHFEQVFHQSHDGVLIARPGGPLLHANPTACSALGRTEAELRALERPSLIVETDELRAMLARRAEGESVHGEVVFRRADGSTFPAEFSSARIRVADEELVYVTFRDLSLQRSMEGALADAESRYRGFFDGVHEAVAFVTPRMIDGQRTWCIVEANRAMHRMVRREELRNVPLRDAIGSLVDERVPVFERVIVSGETEEHETHAVGGRIAVLRVFRLSSSVLCAALLDVTERRRAERELRELTFRAEQQAAELRAILDAVPAGIFIARDSSGERIQVNRFAARMLRLPDDRALTEVSDLSALRRHVVSMRDGVPLREEEGVLVRAARDGVSTDDAEIDIRFDDGDVRHLLGNARPLLDAGDVSRGAVSAFTDVTALVRSKRALAAANAELEEALETTRRAEAQFRQAQKMEAVGRLAGGIAHDFNNLLTVILGQSEMLQDELKSDPLASSASEIRAAGQRAAMLTRQLLAFSRKQALEPRVLSINAILTGMQRMIERLLGESIDVALLLHPELHHCRVDPGQLEQVVLNLVVNARDAMPEGGRLTIETANVMLDDTYTESHPDSRSGPHVMLSVSDTGTGMTPEVRANLFEPFFTTKREGEGTGLGLSTVYGIVKQSGGNIWVYSELAHGSTFKVYFPQAVGAEDALPAKPVSLAMYHGKETILLAEDDARVRNTVSGILRRAGYHVLEASNGGEALLICEQFGGSISLLITDVVMPHMNGRLLAERLRVLRPTMPVLFVSGYTANVVVHHGVVDAGVNFLQKPLTADVLLPKVRDVLNASVETA